MGGFVDIHYFLSNRVHSPSPQFAGKIAVFKLSVRRLVNFLWTKQCAFLGILGHFRGPVDKTCKQYEDIYVVIAVRSREYSYAG